MAANRTGWLIVAILLFAGIPACSAPPREANAPRKAPPGGVLLKGAGATFPAPLYRQWFAAYSEAHPKVEVAYGHHALGEERLQALRSATGRLRLGLLRLALRRPRLRP